VLPDYRHDDVNCISDVERINTIVLQVDALAAQLEQQTEHHIGSHPELVDAHLQHYKACLFRRVYELTTNLLFRNCTKNLKYALSKRKQKGNFFVVS
jgi:hypothetical protein